MAKGFFRGLFGDKKSKKNIEDQTDETSVPTSTESDALAGEIADEQSSDLVPNQSQKEAQNQPREQLIEKVSEPATAESNSEAHVRENALQDDKATDAEIAPPTPVAPSTKTPTPETSLQAIDAENQKNDNTTGEISPSTNEDGNDVPVKKKGLFSRLSSGLSRTSSKLSGGITGIFTKRKLDQETLDDLEDLLVSADLGVAVAGRVVEDLAKDRFDKEISTEEVRTVLADTIAESLTPCEAPLTVNRAHSPHVILMTGVNGAGKTTTIGKLASQFNQQGLKTMLVAADTFRAAAIEQLIVWGERTGSEVVTRDQGADAAGLVFDAMTQAKETNVDVILIDTAGRLQNRSELMDELAKIVRVIKKNDASAPHDVILVLDATVGQNAISQTSAFTEIAGVTGLVMTKLDGTAKGGVLVSLGEKFKLPIHYIGVGEAINDLQPFVAADYSKALTGALSESSMS